MKASRIVDAIASALPPDRPITHHAPYTGPKEAARLAHCVLDHLAGDAEVKRLEAALASRCEVTNVIGLTSGTAALHLALLATGVKAGEEVLVPSLTFVATANAVVYCGAVPHFVDGAITVNPHKLRIHLENKTKPNPEGRGRLNIATGRVISALIVVDLFGFTANWPRLEQLASTFGLILIEDAAQALGAVNGNRPCGSFGQAAILSFNTNKIVTGNGGGALLTNDEWVAAKVWQLATTAKVPHPWRMEHDAVAYNYRMQNLCATLAFAQLEQLDSFLSSKQVLKDKYTKALAHCEGVELLSEFPRQGECNNWLIIMRVKDSQQRDEILEGLHAQGIQARAVFTPLHALPMFADCPRDANLMAAEDTASRAICLPSGVGLAA